MAASVPAILALRGASVEAQIRCFVVGDDALPRRCLELRDLGNQRVHGGWVGLIAEVAEPRIAAFAELRRLELPQAVDQPAPAFGGCRPGRRDRL
jgi:hypothetical protein